MLKRVGVFLLLAPLTLGNLSSSADAAGLGGLAAFMLGGLSFPGGGFHRAPSYPRHYGGFYRERGFYPAGGFYRDPYYSRDPYYPRYDGASYGGYSGCDYGYYGGYEGYERYERYGYDGYGW
jgi:hypothetical protein